MHAVFNSISTSTKPWWYRGVAPRLAQRASALDHQDYNGVASTGAMGITIHIYEVAQ